MAASSSPARAGYSISDFPRVEGNDPLGSFFEFTVTLDTCAAVCSVQYQTTSGGSATAGNDYEVKDPTTLIFVPSVESQEKTVEIKVFGDGIVELNETFSVTLLNAVGGSLDDDTGVGTIINDEGATLVFSDDSKPELDPPFGRTFSSQPSLSAPVDVSVMVSYATADGTAQEGGFNDYLFAVGSRTITAGSTSGSAVTISGIEDLIVERDETFRMQITSINASGRDVTAGADATITIENDDSATISIADLTVAETDTTTLLEVDATMDHPVQGGVNVNVACDTGDGTATSADGDYQSSCIGGSWGSGMSGTRKVRVNVLGDTKVELDEDFVINLGTISAGGLDVTLGDSQGLVTLTNDDSAVVRIFNETALEGDVGTTDFDFEVSLDSDVDVSVGVSFVTIDDTAMVADGDYSAESGSLTLSGIATEAEQITIEVSGDESIEPDEQFKVVLNQLLAGGRDVSLFNTEGIGTIQDDDACMHLDTETLSDETINGDRLVAACLSVTVSPNLFVDAPNGDLTIIAGQGVTINEIEVQVGATLIIVVDPAAVLP